MTILKYKEKIELEIAMTKKKWHNTRKHGSAYVLKMIF